MKKRPELLQTTQMFTKGRVRPLLGKTRDLLLLTFLLISCGTTTPPIEKQPKLTLPSIHILVDFSSELEKTILRSEAYLRSEAEKKGVIQLLWEIFGGKTNQKGYKELDSHIGAIYGDSITLERAEDICERLKQKGFASTNVVLGIGSFTYQYNTRDTFGFAMKATYGEVNGVGREIYKDPITDDGTKKSAKGLIKIEKTEGCYIMKDQVSWEEEQQGELKEVFKGGKLLINDTLQDIRNRVKL